MQSCLHAGMVLPYRTWIRAWNFFYGSAHMAVTVFVFVVRPGDFCLILINELTKSCSLSCFQFLFILKPQVT